MAKKDEDAAKTSAERGFEGAVERGHESSETAQRQWSSQELFGMAREVLITHGDDVYRLRKTRNGKLILHK